MSGNTSLLRGKLAAVAIDGPAGVGKSSVSRAVADRLGWKFIDTGAMYRSVALVAEEENLPPEKWRDIMENLDIHFLPDKSGQRIMVGQLDVTQKIRSPQITAAVKAVADHPGVRQAGRALQKTLAGNGKVVMEGRDICGFVLPEARYKFFLDATDAERSRRRTLQLAESGIVADEAEVAEAIRQRDAEDRARDIAPLAPVDDAFYLDTTHLRQQEVVDLIAGIVEADLAKK